MKSIEEIGLGSLRSRVYHCIDNNGNHFAQRRIFSRRSGFSAFNVEFCNARVKELQGYMTHRHSGLISIENVEVDSEKGEICVTCPLALGGSLEDAQLRSGGCLGEGTLLGVAYSIVNTLVFLHERDPCALIHGVSVCMPFVFCRRVSTFHVYNNDTISEHGTGNYPLKYFISRHFFIRGKLAADLSFGFDSLHSSS